VLIISRVLKNKADGLNSLHDFAVSFILVFAILSLYIEIGRFSIF